jgi:asparagine synthase (glutamine-hydrolysing)
MCGIVGRVNASRDKPIVAEELRAATRSLVHRGPDGEGLFWRGHAGLGHRRLSIVDVAGGAQPISNADGSTTVVLNGEIYNYRELRRELAARGFDFRTRSDTEVIVHGYDAWGEAVVDHLRGMFAFAIWDARRERLLLARDRLGIKPLYWARAGSDLVFASEIKALFAFPDVPRALDDAHFAAYLALRYVPAPDTLFHGIRRLEPAHLLLFENGRLNLTRYWDLPVEAPPARHWNEKEEADRLAQLLVEATRMHLMGEVPVGLFLSGGIDSTAVGWAMKANGVQRLKSFSVGFDSPSDPESELAWARAAASALGAEHREVRVTAADFRDGLADLVYFLDEPNADGACIPLMHLARRAREEVVVVLSGEGADEALAGYPIYRRMLAIDRLRAAGGRLLSFAAAASMRRLFRNAKLRKYVSMLRQPMEARYLGVGRAFGDELLVETFGPRALDEVVSRFVPLWARTEGAPALTRMLYNDTRVWLPDDLLIKADKMAMSSAIELRVPFLDHVMVENAWRLPAAMKIRNGVGKHLLRRAMEGRIPEAILRRPKRGFPVPIGRWLRTTLHAPCRERLLAADSSARTLVGPRMLQRLLDEHRQGIADRTEELHALWVYEEWHRTWLAPRWGNTDRNVMKPASRAGLWQAPAGPGAGVP